MLLFCVWCTLHSTQELKYKILIKHKKVPQEELVRLLLCISLLLLATCTSCSHACSNTMIFHICVHMHVCPPVQSGRASVEPTCSTVNLRQLSLDSLSTSPTRSKAQRGRRSSVPGTLSVSASFLAGLGKEKKTGNKKTLQQVRRWYDWLIDYIILPQEILHLQ